MSLLGVHERLSLSMLVGLAALSFVSAACSSSSEWKDPSQHDVRFVEVEPGVRVEILDWRGSGEPVILLAGHGNTGHVFDEFAPRLRSHFHVVALTRRGFGASDQPKDGYDLGTMVKDIVRVLDTLGLHRVDVAGHSIAGDEMMRLARQHPGRVGKLVFMDAAYDRVEARKIEATFPEPPPAPDPKAVDLASPAAVRAFVGRTIIVLPEAEIRATRVFGADGRSLRPVTPDHILRAVATMVERPDYDSLRGVPTLAIYAVPSNPAQLVPRYKTADADTREALGRVFEIWKSAAEAQRQRFRHRVPHARIVEIRSANHYVFISHEKEVLREITAFLQPN